MARAKYQAPKGTQDVLPPVSARWEQLLATYARTVELASGDTLDYDYPVDGEPTGYGTALIRRSALDGRIVARPLRTNDLRGEVRVVLGLFNDAWQHNWGFVPFTEAEMDAMASEMRMEPPTMRSCCAPRSTESRVSRSMPEWA